LEVWKIQAGGCEFPNIREAFIKDIAGSCGGSAVLNVVGITCDEIQGVQFSVLAGEDASRCNMHLKGGFFHLLRCLGAPFIQ
jgi:hypothetical protein